MRRRRAGVSPAVLACLLGAVLAWAPSFAWAAPAPDLSICPSNMPLPEDLDPVFLIGSASGNSYYRNAPQNGKGIYEQLLACGWPEEKVIVQDFQATRCMLEEVQDIFDEVESTMTANGWERADFLGYSIGGPRIRTWIGMDEGWRRAKEVVLWGSPNKGMTYTAETDGEPLCWHQEITEPDSGFSDFVPCMNGESTLPTCPNVFRDFTPLGVSSRDAGDGIIYYNILSDDYDCEVCRCEIWCDGEAHKKDGDSVVVGANSRLPGAYNIDIPKVGHWDFFMSDPNLYGFAFFEPPLFPFIFPQNNAFANNLFSVRNMVFRETMRGLLGRAPSASLQVDLFTSASGTVPGFSDGDTVPEASDNCPFDANQDQLDGDGDGVGDACDRCPNEFGDDLDSDGACPSVDNCPDLPNADQADADEDGLGDACDPCPNLAGGDFDDDGFLVCEDDCDDDDPSVHPGAAERCNGADDDCDGSVDEGFGDKDAACEAGVG
ncbi:MAG: putative metal-binding motif-containing protein, partial [Candidatus Methylomirabilis sp.]|nr:putative metal-binding motif-containing protein [Deltaproteobacteria bacterium]